MSVGGKEDRKPPPMPEESGKSKVASWLTNQPSTSQATVKMEGLKIEKKVRGGSPYLSQLFCAIFLLHILGEFDQPRSLAFISWCSDWTPSHVMIDSFSCLLMSDLCSGALVGY